MERRFDITVASVNAIEMWRLSTPDKHAALDFLKHYDHEGATVTVKLTVHDKEAYDLIAAAPEAYR